jgi:hypothetical protein
MSGERMSDDHAPPCPRTRGLIDRIVGERVNADDLGHAATCATCGPVLIRATKFDEELRRTARGLVAEELPRGILDPALGGAPRVIARHAAPGLAGIVAAVAIMLVAMSVALFPGGLGGPTEQPGDSFPIGTPGASIPMPVETPSDTGLTMPGPLLRPTFGIGGSLIQNDWRCSSGRPLPSAGPDPTAVDHEGIFCRSSEAQVLTTSVLTTGESIDDEVVEVAVQGDLVVSTATAISEMAETLSKAAFVSVGDKERAPTIADWVITRVPELKAQPGGDSSVGIFGDLRLTLQLRPDGSSYLLLIQAQPRG